MFQYKGPEADEIVGGRVAPKKAERKKIARVGQITRDQAPAASKDGMSISERRLFESMQQGKKTKKKKREREDEDGKQQQKQQADHSAEGGAAAAAVEGWWVAAGGHYMQQLAFDYALDKAVGQMAAVAEAALAEGGEGG